jgi:hypothetical protein
MIKKTETFERAQHHIRYKKCQQLQKINVLKSYVEEYWKNRSLTCPLRTTKTTGPEELL